jgi:hypothetical protein
MLGLARVFAFANVAIATTQPCMFDPEFDGDTETNAL